jgi:hypothetical protein
VKLRAAALAVGNGVVVGCAGLLAGWLLWRRAAAGELDPYDSGVYWEGALVAALLLGLVSGHVSGIFTAAVGLVLAPIGGTFELAEETRSPFGPLGIVFVLPFAFVLAFVAWGGFALRGRLARFATSRR